MAEKEIKISDLNHHIINSALNIQARTEDEKIHKECKFIIDTVKIFTRQMLDKEKGNMAKPNEVQLENLARVNIYLALEKLSLSSDNGEGDSIAKFLNESGYASLTVCPHCHVDDFTHVEECKLAVINEKL